MRFSFRLITLLCCLTAISACGSSGTSEKTVKDTSTSGREEVVLRIAHASESAGDFAEAEKQYKQAISLSGNSIDTRLELVEFYKRHHGERQAEGVLDEALKIDPNNVLVMRTLANVYINQGKPDEALELLNKAIGINSKDAFLYNSQGVALDMTGRYAEAQKSYQTALLLSPDDAVTFKVNLSMSYILSGEYDSAIHLLLPLLESPNATPTVRQNLALAYGMKGESDEALKLGLKDLSTTEAQENLKFYRMLAAKHKKLSGHTQKPVADKKSLQDLFPEEDTPEDDSAIKDAPKSLPSIKPAAISVEHTAVETLPSTSAPETTPDAATLPVPTLKPDRVQ